MLIGGGMGAAPYGAALGSREYMDEAGEGVWVGRGGAE